MNDFAHIASVIDKKGSYFISQVILDEIKYGYVFKGWHQASQQLDFERFLSVNHLKVYTHNIFGNEQYYIIKPEVVKV